MARRRRRGEPSPLLQPRFLLPALALGVLGAYLFATAPEPLPDEVADPDPGLAEHTVPVGRLLDLAAAENASFRALYTRDIVGPGLAQGLVFDEHWLKEGTQTGPLPAVALRGIAVRLQRSATELDLFLGAEFAINRGNRFRGRQLDLFRELVADRQPKSFFDEDQGLYTAMYPDFAVAPPCVDCHSHHPKTPKNDWALGDVMGATTWTFPRQQVTVKEVVEALAELRAAFRATYASYVDHAVGFDRAPEVGLRWPRDGLYLPDTAVFMEEHARLASPATVAAIEAIWREANAED